MAFYNLAFRPQTHVGIEIETTTIPALEGISRWAEAEGRRMLPCYGVDQADSKVIWSIIDEYLGRGAAQQRLDLVIDDASHLLDKSIASFEMLFPLVRPGGVYAIEDWGWAHWDGFQKPNSWFADRPALSNMIFQLLILHTCRPDIISHIHVTPVVVFVTRGNVILEKGGFRIADHLVLRGRKLELI